MGQNVKFITMTGEFTRPNNTTAYNNNKVVANSTSAGTIMTLSSTQPSGSSDRALVVGGSYMVKSVQIDISSSGTTNATFDVYLYTSGVTAFNDGDNFTLTYANKSVRIGKVSLQCYTGDTNSSSKEAINVDVDHLFTATGENLYAIIVATGAYTPTAQEKFYLKVLLANTN